MLTIRPKLAISRQYNFKSNKADKNNKTEIKWRKAVDGRNFYFKDGVAYDENNNLFEGDYNNVNGVFNIMIRNGRIVQSSLGNDVYKMFGQVANSNDLHRYADGSVAKYSDMLETDETTVRTAVDIKNHTITQNWYSGRKNGPKYFYVGTSPLENKAHIPNKFKIINLTDEPTEVEFKTLQEAQDYFASEYGIDAEFKDLAQAHLVKIAVDKFVALNYKNKGDRLFEGLKIRNTDDISKSAYAHTRVKYHLNGIHLSKLDTQEEIIDKISKPHKEKYMGFEEATLYINNNINYDDYKMGYYLQEQSTAFTNSIFVAALCNYIRAKYSTEDWYVQNHTEASKEDIKTISLISKGAARSGKYSAFIAQYIAGRLEGHTYSDEVNELYKRIKGPKLFEDLKNAE